MSRFLIYSQEDYAYLLQPAGYAVLIAALVATFIIGHLLFRNKLAKKVTSKQIAFSGIAMALALVTSFIKFGSLPFGGSITFFSMFFICFIGYMYGTRIGLLTGVAYGILQLITGPYIFAPLQVLLDYPLAFGALGLSGIFSKSKYGMLKGYSLGVLGRFVFHFLSGQIFFLSYAPEGMNATFYNLTYNASYLVPEFIVTCILIGLPPMTAAIRKIKEMANTQ
jgi:thiamine transporter